MSEANKDLLEKYRKEVALRRKYHEQLVELKGTLRNDTNKKTDLKDVVQCVEFSDLYLQTYSLCSKFVCNLFQTKTLCNLKIMNL